MWIKKYVTYPIFGTYQYAYREGYSNDTVLASNLDNIFYYYTGKVCLSESIDYSTAFDNVHHQLPLSGLAKNSWCLRDCLKMALNIVLASSNIRPL